IYTSEWPDSADLYASRLPSGEISTSSRRYPFLSTCWAGADPSRRQIEAAVVSATYTIAFPSGVQLSGYRFSLVSNSGVSGWTPARSFRNSVLTRPVRFELKIRAEPSGDQTGSRSSA